MSGAIGSRLTALEVVAEKLRAKLADENGAKKLPSLIPSTGRLDEQQLGDVNSILEEGGLQRAMPLRKLIGEIVVTQMLPPGKSRGYPRLTFRVDAWQTIKSLLREKVQQASSATVVLAADGTEEFKVDLGAPTSMDDWAP